MLTSTIISIKKDNTTQIEWSKKQTTVAQRITDPYRKSIKALHYIHYKFTQRT